jgi:uncharacterized protein (DUF1501 family)
MRRRSFVQIGAAGLVAAAGPVRLHATPSATRIDRNKVLVWLELNGGNDGLNTIIPYKDSQYLQARPNLAIADGPQLTSDFILHPALSPLVPLWRDRRLAVALGVGWPDPTRSHFRAMDQWSSGTPDGTSVGWIAAQMDRTHSMRPLVSLGPSGSRSLEGGRAPALQLATGLQPLGLGPDPLTPDRAGTNMTLRRMLEVEATGAREMRHLRTRLRPLPSGLALPAGALGQQVGMALRLIASDSPPAAVQMAQGGYDTHSSQARRHEQVLHELALALAAFDRGLRALTQRPQVTLLVTSEFGRRFTENQSGGTDHGSASVAFIVGDHVPHPFIGSYPSLNQRDERGDLRPNLTPSQLYERVLAL